MENRNIFIRNLAGGRPLPTLVALMKRRDFRSAVDAARAVAKALGLDQDQEAQLLCAWDEGRYA